MDEIVIYQKPTRTTCRKVYAALTERGVDFKAVDYYVGSISKTKLKNLLHKMSMAEEELLRKNEPIYRKLELADKKLSQNELLNLMVQHPDLIQRPIVEKKDKAILARPAERVLDFLSGSSAES